MAAPPDSSILCKRSLSSSQLDSFIHNNLLNKTQKGIIFAKEISLKVAQEILNDMVTST